MPDAALPLATSPTDPGPVPVLDRADHALMTALQDGLPLTSRPYAALGARVGLEETAVLERLQRLRAGGIIRRFGAIVRHHEVGYRANAMAVFDIPDSQVSTLGARLATEPAVTLCYRRHRAPGRWPYNLYCMIHGTDRAVVEAQCADLRHRHGLDAFPHALLFSLRRFKQTAGRYSHGREA